MATQQEVLKIFMATLDATSLKGTDALDAAIKACSNFNSFQDLKNKIVSDCKSVGDSETFLLDYCDIILGNEDTGAITGSDAENATVKTAKSVVHENGELENFTGNEFTVDGLTVKLGKGGGTGKIQSRTFGNLSAQEKYIWQSLYTYWIKNCLELIGESYGENFSFNEKSSAANKTLYVIFDNSDNGILASTWGGPTNAQKSVNDMELHINLYFYNSATGEDGIPNSNQTYLDRIIAHELTHSVMRANIDYFDYLPKWLKEGMADLTHGVDDRRTSDLRILAGNSSYLQRLLSGLSVSRVKAPSYSGGYLTLRYLAKQAADTYIKNFSGTDADDQFETHNDSVTISGGAGNDSLGNGFYTSANYSLNGGDYVLLNGGADNDSLMNCAGNFVTLAGGKGNDTIINRNGENVLIGYAAGDGNDSVIGFNETSTLSISGGTYSTQKSGSDLIVKVGDGLITLNNAATLSTLNIDGDSSFVNLTDSSASKVTLDGGVEVGDASSRTKAIRIIGNALDNSILGGSGKDTLYGKNGDDYLSGGKGNDTLSGASGNDSLDGGNGNDSLHGGTGNDTLWGGAGNDTFTGGSGSDVFIYSAGNDFITDYATGDKISLGAAVDSATLDGSNAVLTIGNGSLTVKKTKALTLIDSSGTELTTIVGGMIYDNGSTSKVTLDGGIEVGDASSRTKAIRIIGNALDNSILGGSGKDTLYGKNGDDYLSGGKGNDTLSGASGNDSLDGGNGNDSLHGGTGNDTLWGGTGNDTLIGGSGSDVFIYTAGKDVIGGFANNDFLQISGDWTAAYNSSANSIAFKVGSTANALTLKNFTATTFNINGDVWRISGKQLVK